MSLSWLHVSDFHVRAGDPYDRDVVLRALVASVKRYRERGRRPDLIFATGDVSYSGKPAEYEIAERFFDALLEAAGLERRHLFVIPGNHDVNRDLGVGLARTLESREQADSYFAPGIPKPHLTQKLGAFVEWYNRYFEGIRSHPENSTCGPVEIVDVRGERIAVLPVNSALFCQDDDDHGRLFIGRRCLDPALATLRDVEAHLRVALVHHPLEWLSEVERANVRASLHESVDVVLRGHLHENDVETVVSPSGTVLHVAAGAAYQTRRWPNRALYATLDGERLSIYPIRYEDQPRELWTLDPSVFPDDEPGFERSFPLPRPATPAAGGSAGVATQGEPAPAPPRFRSNVASRGELPFVGREALLEDILACLDDPSRERVLVLHGPPGVGKSELAREFARRNRERYPGGTFFIRAGSGGELVDLARIGANHLDLPFPQDLSLQDQCERTLLSFTIPVLLVYDDVRSMEAIQPWLPPAGMPCHVLITSISERWGPGWPSLHVPPLTEEHSLRLIEGLGGEAVARRHGKALAALGGGLPIQIAPAAATLAYEARRGRLDAVRLAATDEARNSFRLVYERLDEPVRLLLHVAASFNVQRIPRDDLLGDPGGAAGWSEGELQRLLDVCLDLHLLEGDLELRMHQLFASFVRDSVLSPENSEILEQVRRAQWDRMVELATQLVANPANRELAGALLVFPLWAEDWRNLPVVLSDAEFVGRALLEIGKFEEARQWYERAVEEKRLGDVHGRVDHESLGRSLYQVGSCLSSEGRYEEARLWYERAVEEARQGDVHGRIDYESLGASLHAVGFCLSRAGRFKEARPWYERAVEEKRQGDVHGRVDHTSLGTSLHQVGFCLSREGRYMEARPWYERAVEEAEQGDIHRRVNHESLGASLHEVGICLSMEGKDKEARHWYERAVEEAEQGDIHGRVDYVSLGRSLYEVGFCLSSEGKYEEARPWYERAVKEARQGDIHGRVDQTSLSGNLHQVGFCLLNEGKYEEARPWFEYAVEEARQGDVHGRVDHDTLGMSLHAVGFCLASEGKYAEARPWYERAVEEKRQGDVHGRVDHASLGGSLHLIGFCLSSEGKYEAARPWYERAAEEGLQGDVHGRVDHASLGVSLDAVGFCLSSEGRHEEARPWYERAVEEKRQGDVHGRVDPNSLIVSLVALADCLRRVGEDERADALDIEIASLKSKPT